MSELSDTKLHEKGLECMKDKSLYYWYARIDMTTRHRLLALANEYDRGTSVLFNTSTLSATLMHMFVSGSYMGELITIDNSLKHKLGEAMAKT